MLQIAKPSRAREHNTVISNRQQRASSTSTERTRAVGDDAAVWCERQIAAEISRDLNPDHLGRDN